MATSTVVYTHICMRNAVPLVWCSLRLAPIKFLPLKLKCGISNAKSHSSQVDVVSHHSSLQVNLGPSGEDQLYNIGMTFVTGTHEGSPAILRNTMRQNSAITVMNMEKTIEKYTLAVGY